MKTLFIPYNDDTPAVIPINGQDYIVISADEDAITHDLELFGANDLRQVCLDNEEELEGVMRNLAAEIRGGAVLAPEGVALSDFLEGLEANIPWVH